MSKSEVGEVYNNRVCVDGFGLGEPLDPVLFVSGDWAVTTYGIEHLSGCYVIEANRLEEPGWIRHMREKGWVVMSDFIQALTTGKALFNRSGKLKNPALKARALPLETFLKVGSIDLSTTTNPIGVSTGLRFRVLQRDGYKCQLCGKSVTEGARLEVDHRHPKSKGGKDTMENLWTLCFECNRGKRDKTL